MQIIYIVIYLRMPISVVIITHNEEENLPRTLSKLSWCDDIIIVDSYSNDKTESVAKQFEVNFTQHPFEGYGQQKNFGASLSKK
jgi:glycosyltransferase involved in cell wall biosynthesis